MKRWLGLFAIIFIFSAATARADQKPVSAGLWNAYWAKFQAAVAADDKEKVAALTQFPFTYQSPIDKAAFLKVYAKIFDVKTKKCLAKEKPVKDENGGYSAFCGETLYYFTPVAGDFRFTDIGAND